MSSFTIRLRRMLVRHWQPFAAFTALFAVIGGALLYRLNNLLPGYSANEVASYHASTSLRAIWENPINAPYELLVHVMQYIVPDRYLATRLASVLLGWLTIVLFCALLYRWHGTRTAVLGTLLFGTSSWFLHIARLGTPEVLLFGVVAIVACGVWMRARKAGLAVLLGLLLSALLLYTPGMIWFLAIGLLWQWPAIDRAFKQNLGNVTLGSIFFFGALAPLAWHFYQHPKKIIDWLCLPDAWNQPLHLLGNIIDVPLNILFHSPQANPEEWLGQLPVLSVFGVAAFALGVYVYLRHAQLARVKLFLVLGSLGSVVIGLSDGRIGLSVLVPFVYVIVAAGAGYLLDIWTEVFPRNPIAKALGGVCVGVVLAMACIYNLQRYFVAWPGATTTREVFTEKQP